LKKLIVRYEGGTNSNLPLELEIIADQLREGYIRGATGGAKWWSRT